MTDGQFNAIFFAVSNALYSYYQVVKTSSAGGNTTIYLTDGSTIIVTNALAKTIFGG